MRKFSKKYFIKSCGGAVLFQVLLGLGLMVVMSPVIFNQIKKYNEGIQREEVISHMEVFQKAVTSFVTFEKDKKIGESFFIPDGTVKHWSGTEMDNALRDYLGVNPPPKTNGFGQTYSFITNRKGDAIEAVVVASGGGVSELVLNGIGQFLFDKGAVMAYDGTLLSDLSLSAVLSNEVKKMVSPSSGGALLMFVNDAFFSSDFLHIAEMPGESDRAKLFNTMIVDLDMNGRNVRNVKNLYSVNMDISSGSLIDILSVNNLKFDSESSVKSLVEFQNTSGIGYSSSSSLLPITANDVYIDEFSTSSGTSQVKRVDIDEGELETSVLDVENYHVLGNVSVKSGWKNMSIDSLKANTLLSSGGSKYDNVDNVIMLEDGDGNSYIYVGGYDEGEEKFNDNDSLVFNLSGISEVKDICIGSNCISDRILEVYTELQNALNYYVSKRKIDEDANND